MGEKEKVSRRCWVWWAGRGGCKREKREKEKRERAREGEKERG